MGVQKTCACEKIESFSSCSSFLRLLKQLGFSEEECHAFQGWWALAPQKRPCLRWDKKHIFDSEVVLVKRLKGSIYFYAPKTRRCRPLFLGQWGLSARIQPGAVGTWTLKWMGQYEGCCNKSMMYWNVSVTSEENLIPSQLMDFIWLSLVMLTDSGLFFSQFNLRNIFLIKMSAYQLGADLFLQEKHENQQRPRLSYCFSTFSVLWLGAKKSTCWTLIMWNARAD